MNLHISSVLLLAAGFLVTLSASQSSGRGVCSRTVYSVQFGHPASETITQQVPYGHKYKCGLFNWRRCRRTVYRSETIQQYRATYRIGSSVQSYCCPGYTGIPPNCQPVTCPTLPSPPHGDVSYSSQAREYQSLAQYSCSIGYRMRGGSSSRTCQANRRWSGSQPTCEAVDCLRPTSPSNGRVWYTSIQYNGVAHYECNTGYELNGAPTRTCQISGSWSGSQPSCALVTCPAPNSPSNGRVSYDSTDYNSVANYSCNTGYILDGSETRRCQLSGSWSGSQPSCSRIRCPTLTDPSNGQVNVSSHYPGGAASYSCNYGYRMEGWTSDRTCRINGEHGQWTGARPYCRRVLCPVLSNPSNGRVSYSTLYYESVARYSCAIGYRMIGSSRRICQEDDQWSGSQPTCESINCSPPRAPANGSMYFTSTQYDGTIHYSCDSGYRLNGPVSRTCQSNGQWSDRQPTCERISCTSLPSPLNGSVTISSYYPGGKASYSCNYGYRMEGLMLDRVCQVNGQWTGTQPTCTEICCPTLVAPGNGTVRVTSNTVGSVATFYCVPTHSMVGPEQLTCQVNGEWDDHLPTCIELCKPSIGFALHHLSLEEGDTKEVCLRACSCEITSQLTVEIKAWRQDNGDKQFEDIDMPDEITVRENETCFEISRPDNDLLEGFQAVSILMYRPEGEDYKFCQGSESLPVSLVDDDELEIGFETAIMEVDEGSGSTEVCVMVHKPNTTVPIPDVVVNVYPMYLGEAKAGEDYNELERLILPISSSSRRACFSVTIIEDARFEKDEKFSVLVDRNSEVDPSIPISFYPNTFTMTILDNDGITLGFEVYEMTVPERSGKNKVCIKARFSSNNAVQFSVLISTRSLTAEADEDYESINSCPLGPFSYSTPQHCFVFTVNDDSDTEDTEMFTLEIEEEPSHVKVENQTVLVFIESEDEPTPCDSPLRPFFPELFKHCTDCKYSHECSGWKEKLGSRVEVHTDICKSEKMYVETCSLNATEGENCEPRIQKRADCVPSPGDKLMREVGAGNVGSSQSTGSGTTPSPPRGKRSGDQAHCYEPQNALSLTPQQCDLLQPGPLHCQYSNNKIQSRNLKKDCHNRSVLFVVDSSHSVGYDLFKEISSSLSHFVKHLCGNVQFGLVKYSSAAYLEFCFDCFSNNEREKLQERIINMKYLGHTSFTGYATRCVNSFMFDGSGSCGEHDGRCVDIIFVTDGLSSDRAFINVCDQVECLHRNPHISDKLNIYALNIGDSAQEEAECITKYSNKLRDGSPPIFNFDSVDDLIVQVNKMIRAFGVDQYKLRESGKKPEYQCYDWFKK